MTFISIREMSTRPAEIWQQLQEEGELIVTFGGRTFALMISVADEDVEELLLALRRARAQMAVSRLRKQAVAGKLDRMTAEEIEAEINISENTSIHPPLPRVPLQPRVSNPRQKARP